MRGSRLLSMLIHLQLRERLTAEALAAEFGVSVRTVYRDIDELSAAGIPVQGERGPGGGFQLLDGYRTRLTGLTAQEAEALLMIGLPGPAAALGLGAAAAGARAKMLASLPAASSTGASRLADRFYLDPIDWYRAAEPVAHLPALARAVLGQQLVAMTYESWTRTREWVVEPLGLVMKAGGWYLVARSGNTIRTFRVSNVLALGVRAATFERPVPFDLPAYWAASLERFESSLRSGSASIRVSPVGRQRLTRLGAYAARAVEAAEPAGRPGLDPRAPADRERRAGRAGDARTGPGGAGDRAPTRCAAASARWRRRSRAGWSRSVLPQREQRIEPRRAPGGEPRGHERDAASAAVTPANTSGSRRADVEQQRAQRAGQGGRAQQAGGDAERRRWPCPGAGTAPGSRRGLGADRHADADLARALSGRVRHHAVDADRGQQQGEAREGAEHDRLQPRPRPAEAGTRSSMVRMLDAGTSGSSGGCGRGRAATRALGSPAPRTTGTSSARPPIPARRARRRAAGATPAGRRSARPRPRPRS